MNQIIKFIIKQFLSSYLIYNEEDLEEKAQDDSGIKNIINIQDLKLNVSNINNKHLLHSPIKLLKGKFGKFILDINDDNKIIVTIEDVSLDLMPIFNFYKKYQETIFNMEETKKQTMIEAEKENKAASGNKDNPQNVNKNTQPTNNSYMLNMANKLLTNLEINIKNVSMRLFSYEISEKLMENPTFSFFIMSINIYKNENIKKEPALTDPNTYQTFEKSFLDNLVIDFDKLCLKLDNNTNNQDLKDFAEINKFCSKNGKNLTKEQENKILNFFINYNTIFAFNYKKGPGLSIKLNTVARIEKYKEMEKDEEKEKQKIVEDMNVEINIAEVESIITPHQLFNIQIMSQISNFIFTLNKNTPNKQEEKEKKTVSNTDNKKEKKEEKPDKADKADKADKKDNNSDSKKEEEQNSKFSLIFKKYNEKKDDNEISNEKEDEIEDINNKDNLIDNKNNIQNINVSLIQKPEKIEKEKKEEIKKTEVLNHELSKFNITMNCKRIVFVALENKDNESIPKLFSFLMEDEIISMQKNLPTNKKKENIKPLDYIIFGEENSSFENYYCYFEDNLLLFKIDNINSVNTCINVNSVLAEYIQPIMESENKINKNEQNKASNISKSKFELSIYESASGFKEPDGDFQGSDVFQSALENTQLLIMENYSRFINKYIAGEYKNTKFEILTINDIKFDINDKSIIIDKIFLNVNYMIILLAIKIMSKVEYFMNFDGKPIYTIEEEPFQEEDNLNINLEKRINDTELQLFNNLKKKHQKDIDDSDSEEGDRDLFEESIGFSEEEKKKNDGMKIKINYISVKIHNISTDPKRFDNNIYYFNLFQEMVYPNLSTLEGAKLTGPMKQYFQDILSKDFLELVLIDMDMIYYSVSSISNINIVFKELLFNYWNETVIKYTNMNNKNDLDGNPNITITLPGLDMVVNFIEEIKINLDKSTIDNLMAFVNNILYGLSMYQIYDKYCKDIFNNKLINLFDLFGLKNHIKVYKNLNTEEDKKEDELILNKKISSDKKAIKEIEKQMNKRKPNMSIGGKISCCVINLNKNKSFDEEEGNLVKIKMVDVGASLEMFDTNQDNDSDNKNQNNNQNIPSIKGKESKESISINNEKEEPIYNVINVSVNNIFFLIKEQSQTQSNNIHDINEETKSSYYTLFSKNNSSQFESTDYFVMSYKFRNLKKIKEDITILEADEDEEKLEDSQEFNLNKKISKESQNSKNSDKFKANNVKITLDPKTTDYIAFLLNNQVKLDNMEMVIDIKISETIINSFYDKLDVLTPSLKDIYLDFTSNKKENEGPFVNPGDRIPLCEDRIMFIKCNFVMNKFLVDVFLKEEQEQKNWMRLFLLIDNFKFVFNENGIAMNLNKNYVYILKDFSYVDYMKNINKEKIFDIEDKISDIQKENSYMKRLGYVELFYNDKIEFNKTEKEMSVDLGNINLFFCKDSYDFLLDFIQNFNSNYLNKITEIISKDNQDSEDNEEELEKEEKKIEKEKNIINEKKPIEEKKIEKKKKKSDDFKDFEIVDDVFFIDDSNKNKENKNNPNNTKKNYESLYLKKHPNKLETIEEYGTKKKKSRSDDNDNFIMDDFAIIETNSSLERKMNRVKKEEDCIIYLLKLGSLRIYLFQGSDFNFQDYPNKDLDLDSPPSDSNINNSNNEFIFPDNSGENNIHIDIHYLFKITDPIKKNTSKQIRKRKDPRDYSNYILLNLIDMSFKIVDFSYFDFSIGKFFIDDNFENSQYKKIISKKDFLSENTKFLMCQIELIKDETKSKLSKGNKSQKKDITYIRISCTIPSLDIFVDQLPLNFIIKLLLSMSYDKKESDGESNNKSKSSSSKNTLEKQAKNDKKSEEDNSDKSSGKKSNKSNKDNKDIINQEHDLNVMNSFNSWNEAIDNSEKKDDKINGEEDSSILLIKELLINSFTINFHYNSHKISFAKVYAKGDWIEFLSGLADIKEFKLKFKTFRKTNVCTIPDALTDLINFWKDDILSNQVATSVFKGISITRPFYKLYEGVKDLVKQPYISYKENEGVKKGIKKGMKNFLISFSSQGIFFGEKIFRGMKVVVFRKTSLSLKKKSLYKTWIYKINQKQHDYEMYYYKQD